MTPGAVLRRSLLAWGLGDLALGRRANGVAWLGAEIVAIGLMAYLTIGLANTTWYPIPFLAGAIFLAAWAAQAVGAFKRAQAREGAIGPTPPRSPAAVVAWLTVPILVWGTGYWLLAGADASPAAVVDGFERAWPTGDTESLRQLGLDQQDLAVASTALQRVRQLCQAGSLNADCADAPASLLHDVRFVVQAGGGSAQADADVVSFERQSTTFLGLLGGTELVPVPQQRILHIELREVPAALPGGLELGASRWQIDTMSAP